MTHVILTEGVRVESGTASETESQTESVWLEEEPDVLLAVQRAAQALSVASLTDRLTPATRALFWRRGAAPLAESNPELVCI
jgi:hypothetical protein